jgi:hypothetical protein
MLDRNKLMLLAQHLKVVCRGVAQCIHGVALATPFFWNLINFLIRLCVFTLNYFNNVDLATPNKFICQKIVEIQKIKKKLSSNK